MQPEGAAVVLEINCPDTILAQRKKKDIEYCLQKALHYLLRMSGYQGAAREEEPLAQLSPARSAVTLSTQHSPVSVRTSTGGSGS